MSPQVLEALQRQKRHFPGPSELTAEKYKQKNSYKKTVGEEKECAPGAK